MQGDCSTTTTSPGREVLGVNGLDIEARVDVQALESTVLPALAAANARPRESKRAFVFVVGPPGSGKSTFAALVTQMARRQTPQPIDAAAVGIDGFHYPQAHLTTHHFDGVTGPVPLSAIKGAPETFDVAALSEHLRESRDRDLAWPQYDRRLHDVVPGTDPVRAELVVVEGNWLLLDEPVWRDLAACAAFVICLTSDPHLLRQRLIERKILGGLSPSEATDFYARSDRFNVERFFDRSDFSSVDLTLSVKNDGTIEQGVLP